ncbi:phosphoglycolate phosphatase [Martelella sp. HB161492]|uniref:phosphoglycolate phosphatase n=1 Tax=Martelella sp. HB161492 TaxID=2720726 RepID=UPI00158FB4B4|nr:phosphoglycolate phosphatase [Martelella sp. HB161492]
MPSTLVIFDLDGTLVDTAPDLIESLNHAIEVADLPPFSLEQVNILVGRGVRVMIERAFAFHQKQLDPEMFELCFNRFTEHYIANMPGQSRPYPGLEAALDRLDAAGFDLAVCTNKRDGLTDRLLSGLALKNRFSTIIGGDFPNRKPDPRHVLATIEKAGAAKANSVMIGDSANDIGAAKAAGVATIAVSFGYTDKPVSEYGPDRIIDHYDELTADLITSLVG